MLPQNSPSQSQRLKPGSRLAAEPSGRVRRTRSFAVFQAGEKRRCIGLNAGELFACGLDTALVVGRPPTLERSDVARKVFGAGTHELHTRRLTRKSSATATGSEAANFLNGFNHDKKLDAQRVAVGCSALLDVSA